MVHHLILTLLSTPAAFLYYLFWERPPPSYTISSESDNRLLILHLPRATATFLYYLFWEHQPPSYTISSESDNRLLILPPLERQPPFLILSLLRATAAFLILPFPRATAAFYTITPENNSPSLLILSHQRTPGEAVGGRGGRGIGGSGALRLPGS